MPSLTVTWKYLAVGLGSASVFWNCTVRNISVATETEKGPLTINVLSFFKENITKLGSLNFSNPGNVLES